MQKSDRIELVCACMPQRIQDELKDILNLSQFGGGDRLEEIRIRAFSPICLKFNRGHILGNAVLSQDELSDIVKKLCDGSVYSHSDEIRNGYISVFGMRIGVCGEAVTSHGKTEDIKNITSLNIRMPFISRNLASDLALYLERSGFAESVLVYSPPGVGKTSVLRSLAALISSSPYNKNVALCDPRVELYDGDLLRGCSCDVYLNYPLDRALELAVRTMHPDYIICDEIGGEAEMKALLSCAYMGVPIVASAHAEDIPGLCRRISVRPLIDMGIFNSFVRLTRRGKRISFDFVPASEALAV